MTVRNLVKEERVTELARMLGGEETSSAAVEHAREMLALADQRALARISAPSPGEGLGARFILTLNLRAGGRVSIPFVPGC